MGIPESHLAQEAIAALVDGELPAGPAGRAARHLSGCAQCRMAVEAQREAKNALHGSAEVCMPGDLMSRLCAIPFTADVPSSGRFGGLSAGPDGLTVDDATGSWSVDLAPRPQDSHGNSRGDQARWLRRGIAGTLAGLGLGVAVLALNLPPDADLPTRGPVAGPTLPDERTEGVPPVYRTLDVGTSSALSARNMGGRP
jgi:anti-sigma factor RsiW